MLHRFLRLVSWRGFGAAREFSLAFLVDVSLLAGFHRGLNRTRLARGRIAGLRHDFAGFRARRIVKFSRPFARSFVVLARGFTRAVIVLAYSRFARVVVFGGLLAKLLGS